MGGSGGGGGKSSYDSRSGGGGGGGAILIVANEIEVDGSIIANGGDGNVGGGGGSGGAIRIVSNIFFGQGTLSTIGGRGKYYHFTSVRFARRAGDGWIRIDSMDASFTGTLSGQSSAGFQPIIIPPASQNVSLNITSIGGIAAPGAPSGVTVPPDITLPASLQNPLTVEVAATNIPLGTEIILEAKPTNGATVTSAAFNTNGNEANSLASIHVNLPRGNGTLQAKAVSGISFEDSGQQARNSLRETGLLATGETIAAVEVIADLIGKQQITYLTREGNRYPLHP